MVQMVLLRKKVIMRRVPAFMKDYLMFSDKRVGHVCFEWHKVWLRLGHRHIYLQWVMWELYFLYNFKNAKHPCITKKQVICDGGPSGNMEGENRRLARWQVSKKTFKRSKSLVLPDEKASKGASSVGDIMCDFGSPEFVSEGRWHCFEAESRCGEEPRPIVPMSWGEIDVKSY